MQLDDPPLGHAGYIHHIERPRLERLLAGLTPSRVTVLIGPAGSGKSALVAGLASAPNTICYRVGTDCRTFARFVHGVAQACALVAPGAVASFPRSWERALQSHSPSIVLARWLGEHLNGIDRHLVIDDLHEGGADPSIASFIGTLVELRPDAALTITVRSIGALPVALWMATGRMERPIDESDLKFNRAEMVAAAMQFGVPLDEAAVDLLLAETGGSPNVVAYALARLRYRLLECVRKPPESFAVMAERVFERRTERERTFLFTAGISSSIDDDLLASCGWEDARAIRDAMFPDGAFMWEQTAPDRVRFYDRFREYLVREFQSRDLAFRSTIAQQVVHALTRAGRYACALEVATDHRMLDTMGNLVNAHGFEILEAGKVDVISEALAAFVDSEQPLGASALALRGYIEARSGHLDTAEAWFRLAMDTAQDEAAKVTIGMYYARELTLRRRADAFEVLKPFANSDTLVRSVSRPVLIDVQSSFAQALTAGDQLAEAYRRTEEAVVLLGSDSPPGLRARVLARAAYVALESGAIELARERATMAAPLAEAQSLYDVAASAYSVLYNIAYEIDDDAVASLQYLHHMRDLSAKSGTLRLDIYAMLGLYELHAEAGDEVALAILDRQLASVDKHDATAEIMEMLLPGKALHAGWNGHFDEAQRLLKPSADRQVTPERIALRWAQVGLYCAAAGDVDGAASACVKSADALSRCDSISTKYGLTLLTLALAELVSGNVDNARRRTCSADDATIGDAPRLRALRTAVHALVSDWDDADRLACSVPGGLGQLRSASSGGMAKLIEALPYRSAQSASGTETIGSALAKRELSARFEAALDTGDGGPLRAWLDTLSDVTFQAVGLSQGFETWVGGRGEHDLRTSAALSNLRRRVAAYHRPAPVPLRLVDDIDARIDNLFEHLDLAAPLMAEHSRAVSAWCGRLGRLLALSEDEIIFVTRCGLIHDVGKMRTPPQILEAARQLTAEEWLVMRDHAAEGGRIVGDVPQLRAFMPIVRAHHERLDGTGYPDGLRSNGIPFAARIVAVADSFNAMIGRRPYRLPLAPTDALSELQLHRGTQFDPEIVDAMVRVVLGRLVETPTTISK